MIHQLASSLEPTSVDENQAKGTVIGALTAIDPDAVDVHTFSIVGGKDKKFFAVEDGT